MVASTFQLLIFIPKPYPVIVTALSITLSLIFLLLALIHLSWAAGGRYGYDASIPTNEEGKKLFTPGVFDCIVVAIGLLLFCLFYMANSGIITVQLPAWIFKYMGWIIPSIFLIRAIGDFRYVGLFKKLKRTAFASMDSKFLSPLCLYLAIAGYAVQYFGAV